MWRWERKDGRFYEVVLTRDLFGNWLVLKLHGGKKSGRSQLITTGCPTIEGALQIVRAINSRRIQNKYDLAINDPNYPSFCKEK